ncbi:helix-hairpin-helix domain-containing protein [Anaerosolibacter carboniphilus]|nr:helix-hairpin-helix domain-containing protein [Anaerosolibacter carboniphilus]
MEFTKRERIILVTFIAIIVLFLTGRYFIGSFNKPQVTIQNEALNQKLQDESESMDQQDDVEEKMIAVDIVGEVANPGLVILKEGARIIDAIEAAGGMLVSADRRRVNLARILKDEEQIYVPKIGENIANEENRDDIVSQGGSNSRKVNINQASAAELETLNGIGEALAGRIIQYRAEKGEFKDIKDIMKVSGIGEKKFEGLKDQITVK